MFVDVIQVDVGRLSDAIGGDAIATTSTGLSCASNKALVTNAADDRPVGDKNLSANAEIGVDGDSGLLSFR